MPGVFDALNEACFVRVWRSEIWVYEVLVSQWHPCYAAHQGPGFYPPHCRLHPHPNGVFRRCALAAGADACFLKEELDFSTLEAPARRWFPEEPGE